MKIIFILTVISLIQIIFSQNDKCLLYSGKGTIDLNKVAYSSDIKIPLPNSKGVIINICKPLTRSSVVPCSGKTGMPAVLVDLQDETKCNYISNGTISPSDLRTTWLDPSNPELGARIHYDNGQVFLQDGTLLSSRVEIIAYCDKNEEIPIFFDSKSSDDITMTYKFRLKSKFACPLQLPGIGCRIDNIDLTKLSLPSDVKLTGPGLTDIVINICKPLTRPSVVPCSGKIGMPAVLVNWQDETKCNYISNAVDSNNIRTTYIDPTNPKLGVKLHYDNGQTFTQDGIQQASRSEITINCDRNSEVPLGFEGTQSDGRTMVYKFGMRTKVACPDNK